MDKVTNYLPEGIDKKTEEITNRHDMIEKCQRENEFKNFLKKLNDRGKRNV